MYNEGIQIAPDGGFKGLGILGGTPAGGDDSGITTFSSIVSRVIGVMTIVAIVWFVFIFITGVIGIIGSGGDKQSFENARKKISTGVIGLVIVLLALVLTSFVGKFVGITNILDIGALFEPIINR